MKIGIIVHSQTGNTLAVAKRLKEELIMAGHLVNLEQVMPADENPTAIKDIHLKTIPDTNDYDVLIFGAPVQGFSISPVMKAYLSQLTSLKGKKVGCFVTQYFPYKWMGGTRSVNQMKYICKAKGGSIFEEGIVNWSHKEREKRITEVLAKLMKL
jgi:flavodoxin